MDSVEENCVPELAVMNTETHISPGEMASGSLNAEVTDVVTREDNSLYSYINSSCGSFEQFKIEIGNVSKHITVSVIRKLLLTQGFDPSKIKPSGHGFFFANLRSAEERNRALEKLNGINFRGRELRVKAAGPKADPLLLKRSRENGEHQGNSAKKLKPDNDQTDSTSGSSIAPLANIPYDPNQLRKKQNIALANLLRVRNNVKKVNKFKYCESCLESGFMSQNGRFLGQQYCPITPSPLLTGYRNKAKFTIGFDVDGKGPVIGMRIGKYKEGSTAVVFPTDAPLFSVSTAKVISSMQACLDGIYNQPHEGENADLLNRVAERVQVYDMVAKTGNWQSLTLRESRLNDRLIEIEIRRQELTDSIEGTKMRENYKTSDISAQIRNPVQDIVFDCPYLVAVKLWTVDVKSTLWLHLHATSRIHDDYEWRFIENRGSVGNEISASIEASGNGFARRCAEWTDEDAELGALCDHWLDQVSSIAIAPHGDFVVIGKEDIADLCSVLKQWFEPGGQGESAELLGNTGKCFHGISQQSGTYGEHWVMGKRTITELCCGLKFEISRDAFFQVNTLAAEKLFEDIRRRCTAILERENKSTNDAILLDICCGAGVIGLCLADCFAQVVGIELIPSAVQNAKRNAEINGIKNAEFYAGRAEELLKNLMKTLPKDKEVIAILDPPRAGVHRGVIEAIRQCSRVKHLVFVACDLRASEWNFEAFARPPSKKYVGAPFLPTAASCVDLFPHTPSIEIVISLKRLTPADCNHDKERPSTGEIAS
ncbi:hypothetical protein ACTXT7_002810 [Hymenolepis weldensis]